MSLAIFLGIREIFNPKSCLDPNTCGGNLRVIWVAKSKIQNLLTPYSHLPSLQNNVAVVMLRNR